MKTGELVQLLTLTIVLFIVLTAVIGAAFRVNIGDNWEEMRCDPYVVPIAAFFKPDTYPKSASDFAYDNWKFCQKEYVQGALRVAAMAPQALADAEAGTVGIVQGIASASASIFFDVWKFCYQVYTGFMDKMKGAAALFRNFMVNLYNIAERLNAAVMSIIFTLISLIISVINSIQVAVIVAIIVIGILLALQIILFFIMWPISALLAVVTVLVSTVVITLASAVAAATGELFSSHTCFVKGTPVQIRGGGIKAIDTINIGDILRDGGRVTAVHTFVTNDPIYNLYGIRVSGDHLVADPERPTKRIAVRNHPAAILLSGRPWLFGTPVWCLTTTSRVIPCDGTEGVVMFADWEEIDEYDMDSLHGWYNEVWRTLNGVYPQRIPGSQVLGAEAGLSPDCMVACPDWLGNRVWRPISEIRIGDRVFDGLVVTTVIGRVTLAGDQSTNAIGMHKDSIVSCATWVKIGDKWVTADIVPTGIAQDVHPKQWEHLYTKSGAFTIAGGMQVRDASDVGLEHLRPIVESVILGTN